MYLDNVGHNEGPVDRRRSYPTGIGFGRRWNRRTSDFSFCSFTHKKGLTSANKEQRSFSPILVS